MRVQVARDIDLLVPRCSMEQHLLAAADGRDCNERGSCLGADALRCRGTTGGRVEERRGKGRLEGRGVVGE